MVESLDYVADWWHCILLGSRLSYDWFMADGHVLGLRQIVLFWYS